MDSLEAREVTEKFSSVRHYFFLARKIVPARERREDRARPSRIVSRYEETRGHIRRYGILATTVATNRVNPHRRSQNQVLVQQGVHYDPEQKGHDHGHQEDSLERVPRALESWLGAAPACPAAAVPAGQLADVRRCRRR